MSSDLGRDARRLFRQPLGPPPHTTSVNQRGPQKSAPLPQLAATCARSVGRYNPRWRIAPSLTQDRHRLWIDQEPSPMADYLYIDALYVDCLYIDALYVYCLYVD